ncbi:MAG: GDSL-type esterase/lipase family protein [Verrucomicrobia bacterium]|nr:GDSL-type esterase/lipase family protein [Verrucomicrobiota bacterium]MDA1088068.1 GDSL-type esterase/lipase family protein [Verrucomicrobiota bacterium]
MWHRFACLLVVIAVALVCGCDSGGGGGGGPSIDFGDNDPLRYIAIGDSITRGFEGSPGYPAFLSLILGVPVENRGVGGATTADGVSKARSALKSKPGFLLILYGSNDAILGRSSDAAEANLREIVRMAVANKTVPVIATVPHMLAPHAPFNSGGGRISERIRLLAAEEGARLVELRDRLGTAPALSRDGLHPTPETDALIAELWAERL